MQWVMSPGVPTTWTLKTILENGLLQLKIQVSSYYTPEHCLANWAKMYLLRSPEIKLWAAFPFLRVVRGSRRFPTDSIAPFKWPGLSPNALIASEALVGDHPRLFRIDGLEPRINDSPSVFFVSLFFLFFSLLFFSGAPASSSGMKPGLGFYVYPKVYWAVLRSAKSV